MIVQKMSIFIILKNFIKIYIIMIIKWKRIFYSKKNNWNRKNNNYVHKKQLNNKDINSKMENWLVYFNIFHH